MKIRTSSGMARKNSTTTVDGRLSHAWSESRPAANTAPKTSDSTAATSEGRRRVASSASSRSESGWPCTGSTPTRRAVELAGGGEPVDHEADDRAAAARVPTTPMQPVAARGPAARRRRRGRRSSGHAPALLEAALQHRQRDHEDQEADRDPEQPDRARCSRRSDEVLVDAAGLERPRSRPRSSCSSAARSARWSAAARPRAAPAAGRPAPRVWLKVKPSARDASACPTGTVLIPDRTTSQTNAAV